MFRACCPIEPNAGGPQRARRQTFLTIENTGHVPGKEIVQLYVREQQPRVVRPEKELKAFAKVALQVGEEKTVSFQLEERDFAYYDVIRHDWVVNSGKFEILVGASSQDLRLTQTIDLHNPKAELLPLTRDSLLKEFKNHPKGQTFYPELVAAFGMGDLDEVDIAVRAPFWKTCLYIRFALFRKAGLAKKT